MRRKILASTILFLALRLLYSAIFIYKSSMDKTEPSSSIRIYPTYTTEVEKQSTLTEIINSIKTQENITVTKLNTDSSNKNYEVELVYEGTISNLRELIIKISRECSLNSIDSIDMSLQGDSIKHTVRMTFSR